MLGLFELEKIDVLVGNIGAMIKTIPAFVSWDKLLKAL